MDLTKDEQRLITIFRALDNPAREDAISYLTSLSRHTGASSSRCGIKGADQRPENEKSPIITE